MSACTCCAASGRSCQGKSADEVRGVGTPASLFLPNRHINAILSNANSITYQVALHIMRPIKIRVFPMLHLIGLQNRSSNHISSFCFSTYVTNFPPGIVRLGAICAYGEFKLLMVLQPHTFAVFEEFPKHKRPEAILFDSTVNCHAVTNVDRHQLIDELFR